MSFENVQRLLLIVVGGVLLYFQKISFDDIMKLAGAFSMGVAVPLMSGRASKKLIPLAIISLAASQLQACNVLPKVEWQKVVGCGTQAYDVVPTVSRILLEDGLGSLSNETKRQLIATAADVGTDVVSCVVKQLVEQWRAPGAARAPETLAGADRGEAFLQEMGVEQVVLQ